MELLRSTTVQPGRAVIVVTHDSRVFEFGDRIVYMTDGRIDRVELPHAEQTASRVEQSALLN
jgi:putative ABC transport system ATP-binding protein